MPSDTAAAAARLAEMRALAHPTRVAIVELLGKHPALTATECGNTLGLSAKTCSYHLRTLAAAGVVDEMAGVGRNRPWRLIRTATDGAYPVPPGSGPGHADDPLRHVREKKLAARTKRERSVLGHAVEAVTHAGTDPRWSEAATVYDRVARMSPEELRAWGEDVERLTRRHLRRTAQSSELGDGVVRHPVHLMFYGFPDTPTEAGRPAHA